ncbi:hypothetical protein AVDCRST_MAG92-2980 [uncultured Coleofasciculus sp.]|uniref:Uncharacterized protein n=1 Tax=uncultured Coleofasciculus sp. TaxID=1267456 RepID=A0A6J4J5I2_9CYAN|nr:hypothetical protein AVDCRST_MAG92-2980 [uncultured Coleofasciculus sp.]
MGASAVTIAKALRGVSKSAAAFAIALQKLRTTVRSGSDSEARRAKQIAFKSNQVI